MNNIDYIKFVVSKVELDFVGLANSREYVKVITVLHSLKMADNILRELYILSGIKKLRSLTSYLIFMIKKVEAGSITLDNFMENYLTDKNYINSYFQTYYDLEQISPEEFYKDEINTRFIIDDEEPSTAPVYSLAETGFKVEELDNELVTEEFRDTNINENYEFPGEGYLKLSENLVDNSIEPADINDNFFDDSNEVFNLPGGVFVDDKEASKDDPVNETSVLPNAAFFTNGDEASENDEQKQEGLFEETKDTGEVYSEKGVASPEDVLLFGETDNLANIYENLDDVFVPVVNTDEDVIFSETTVINDDEQTGTNVEPYFVETADNESAETELENKILSELTPAIPNDIVFAPEEMKSGDDREVEEKLLEIEKETSEEVLNSEFLKYEKHLFEKNKLIVGFLNDLILISESNDQDIEMRDSILLEIFPLVEGLRLESGKMSFEIISGIYESFMFCLDIKFKDIVVSKENIDIFKLSVEGVEDLIRGDELKDFDKTIKKLEGLQANLSNLLADREDFQKRKYNFGEEESNLIKEFKDSGEYEAYIILRDKITELEETFYIIAGMKDKTYPFESLRKLSVTFAIFREIVNIARILEMNRVAYLAEAGYVFVKFVQNYRIDPFKEEVTEVFKYLIYSFKLIYLDKPVKDFDTFISFLNDPVKIFYQKPKTDE